MSDRARGENRPNYGRILLKLSGEALLGDRQFGVDPAVCGSLKMSETNLYFCQTFMGHSEKRSMAPC